MVVDTYISKDPLSRVACETLTTTNKVILAGEVRGPETKKEDIEALKTKDSMEKIIEITSSEDNPKTNLSKAIKTFSI